MQMLFQNPYASLNPRMTIFDIVAEPLKAYGWNNAQEIADRVDQLIEATGLPPDAAGRLPVQFSGGQRQRIALARALALQPDMLIADEPVSALDVSVQAQIINLLGDIQKRLGIAYLVIAHDLALVHQISDRIIVMYLGEIVEQGSADNIVAEPAHPYTVSLLAATPVPGALKKREYFVLKGEPPSAIDRPSGCAFHPRCPVARDKCHHDKPRLTQTTTSGMVACHFPGELPSPVKRKGDIS
jgi:oligopeptide/dipeptide ABC transporter ATP-binding protein